MKPQYEELVQRIQDELPELERAVARALRNWQPVIQAVPERDVYLDSVALNLHSFYSGLERLFELIARHVDRDLPTGETWHRDLLQHMAQDRPESRPAVLSHESFIGLDELRRFRHLVRNVYTTNLRPDRMSDLLDRLPDLWPRVRVELLAAEE
ncbi:MAG: antitoxin [Chloroflexota bacterium]|nr:antitoxin [Chloroflexota bacterium]